MTVAEEIYRYKNKNGRAHYAAEYSVQAKIIVYLGVKYERHVFIDGSVLECRIYGCHDVLCRVER